MCFDRFPRLKKTKKGPVPSQKRASVGKRRGRETLDTGVNPYNGLANRRFRPLSHLSQIVFYVRKLPQHYYYNK